MRKESKFDERLSWEIDKIIYIMDSGPMANIYFSGKILRMTVKEVEKKFPGLIDMLANTKGIGFIAGISDGGETVIYDKDSGKFRKLFDFLNDSGNLNLTIKHVIDDYKNKEKMNGAFLSVERFCKFNNSGDLILFGEYDGKNIINFENQMGAHGGIGGEQNVPFAVWRNDIPFDFATVNNSCKIYEFLYNNYKP